MSTENVKPLTDKEMDATYDLLHQAAMSGVDSVFKSEDWHCHPLFLTKLPKDIENDRYLGAFQHVTYDGETPDSVAKNFKDIGNDLFRQGRQNWMVAANWWSRALEEKMTDKKLRSVLHSNRATVSLGLGQYQRAALDANWAIENDKFNKKAYVRAAHAYQGMGNWEKAVAAAKAGLELMEESDPLAKQLQAVIENANTQMSSGSKRTTQFFTSIVACSRFFDKSNFSIGEFSHAWQANWDLVLQFDEDKNETIWPIAIEFDEVLQVDFCDAFMEKTPLIDLISMAFPGLKKESTAPLWDTQERYKVDNIVMYVKTHETKYRWGRETKKGDVKNVIVDQKACLRDIFIQKDYVIPGYPILYFCVKRSVFVGSLNLEEIIEAGGKRRKLNEEEKEYVTPAPDAKTPEEMEQEEEQKVMELKPEKK